MPDMWYARLWDGKLYLFEDQPAFWTFAVDDEGRIPLCHDGEDY